MVIKKTLVVFAVATLFLTVACFLAFHTEQRPNGPGAFSGLSAYGPTNVEAVASQESFAERNSRLPLNDSFEFPFLGRVQAHAKVSTVSIKTVDGKHVAVPFKIYYRENGQFLRAEFNKPGAKDYSFDAEHNRRRYIQRDETVNGLPAVPARVPFEKILGELASEEHAFGIDFTTATKIDVTYVTYTRSGDKPTPVYIINVFGCHSIAPEYFADRDESAKRIRYIVDGEGKTWLFDNNL